MPDLPLVPKVTVTLNLNRLNDRQREAVLHGNGPLLVLAGAGSGKTSTMTYRIAHLVSARHVSPAQILGLSFTRKAAGELKERVRKLITDTAGKGAARGLTVTTFHSLCVRILRAHADKIGYNKDFTILDQNDQVDVLRQILRNIKVDDRKFDPDMILFEIGQAKNRFLSPEKAEAYFLGQKKLPEDYAIITANAFGKYQDQLRALDSMDFDDLLYNAVRLLEQHEDVRTIYNDKFRHILVDEYQDTNPAQFKLLRMLTQKQQNICVVGDDDQSIYAWRGADPKHILEFSHHYPGARTITLDQNYRSTNTILEAANKVIAENKHRHAKSLWSDKGLGEPIEMIVVEEDRAEAEVVAEEILKRAQQNIAGHTKQLKPWKDFAILYRSNPQSRLFEEALRMRQIPYRLVGAMSFLDRKEIKDTLSYWRLVVNPKDDASARRVINWPSRGIGKTTMETINQHAVAQGISFFEALSDAPRIATRGAAGAIAFRNLIQDLRKDLEQQPLDPVALANWAKRSLEKIGVKQALEEESDDPVQFARKWENIDELANALGQLKIDEILEEQQAHTTPKAETPTRPALTEILVTPGSPVLGTEPVAAAAPVEFEPGELANSVVMLREYLTRMTVEASDDKDEKDEQKDQVTLLTLHGAKGLEYPVVFLVGMEEGFLPHKRTIEEAQDFSEERRLCYVGVTRAKEYLIMTRAKNRIRYGKPVPRTPSRFLQEMPSHLIVTRDESYSPDLSSKEAQEKHETKVKDFLAQIRAQIQGNGPTKGV